MEECPDRDSSNDESDSESDSITVGTNDSESEREICTLCIRATSGIWAYPCGCERGIRIAHLLCFDAYRNSWPIDHPNRNFCSYCHASYDIASTMQDLSHCRKNNYTICYTVITIGIVHSIPALFLEPLLGIPAGRLTVCLYMTNIYNTIDLILSNQGVSTMYHKWCGNIMSLIIVSCVLIFVGMFQSHATLILYASTIVGIMLKRVYVKWKEIQMQF
jgi:hypothetical protein